VRPTLAAADANAGPAVLAYGATVAAVDDPDFAVGTVLRAFAVTPDLVVYDVRPDDPPLPPRWIPADDVTPLTGTAWPTVQDLLHARETAGLPLLEREILVTLREATIVVYGPDGPAPKLPPTPLPPVDRVLDPGRPTPAAPGPATPTAAGTAVDTPRTPAGPPDPTGAPPPAGGLGTTGLEL
jgi:hypothetical protein